MNNLNSPVAARNARVVTGVVLTDKDKKDIRKKILASFPDCDDVEFLVSKDLVAGIKITYQDNIYVDTPIHSISQEK
ncbi:hypothetical protein IPM62_03585 [Candidatus Woesebacteria bacterium]|nr:MAG: hypothetical protein IPM62_03585 [Candidatus Woesebacteria bacterium]